MAYILEHWKYDILCLFIGHLFSFLKKVSNFLVLLTNLKKKFESKLKPEWIFLFCRPLFWCSNASHRIIKSNNKNNTNNLFLFFCSITIISLDFLREKNLTRSSSFCRSCSINIIFGSRSWYQMGGLILKVHLSNVYN